MTNESLNRALETNSYTTSGTGASLINPDVWVRKIEEFAKAKTVMEPLGRKYVELVGQAGDSLKISYNDEIAAGDLTENVSMVPESFGYTQITFSPSEVGVAVALTRKQRIRPINDIMSEKTMDMGYALAKKLDQDIFAALDAGVTGETISNGVAVGAITSADTISTEDIAEAIGAIRAADYSAKYIVIHPFQEKALMKLDQFIDASIYGGREVVMNGEIGKYLGLRVLVTTLVPTNATTATAKNAYVLDQDAFGVAWKMMTTFNSDYKVLDREFILAAVNEYDVQVLRDAKAHRIISYAQ